MVDLWMSLWTSTCLGTIGSLLFKKKRYKWELNPLSPWKTRTISTIKGTISRKTWMMPSRGCRIPSPSHSHRPFNGPCGHAEGRLTHVHFRDGNGRRVPLRKNILAIKSGSLPKKIRSHGYGILVTPKPLARLEPAWTPWWNHISSNRLTCGFCSICLCLKGLAVGKPQKFQWKIGSMFRMVCN